MIKLVAAQIAQLEERETEDLEVAGSNPAPGIFYYYLIGSIIVESISFFLIKSI